MVIDKKSHNAKLFALAILWFCGISLLNVTYFFAYNGNFYNHLFWVSVLLFIVPTFLIIIDQKIHQSYKIIFLLMLGTALYIMSFLPSTVHFHFADELSTFGTSKLIYETGNLNIKLPFELTKYYPGLELVTIFLKNLTGLDFFTTAKILIGLIHSFVLVFIYLLLRQVSASERIATYGAFIYAINPIYIYFYSVFSYESLGIFLLIMLLYIIARVSFVPSLYNSKILLRLLILITLSSLTITHHLSSMMALFFIFVLTVIQIYKSMPSKPYQKFYINLTSLTATLSFGWMIYVATIAINHLIGNFIRRFYGVFELSLFGGGKTDLFSTSLTINLLPYYEFIIDTYVYAPSILLLSFIGIYFIKRSGDNSPFTYMLIICGPILYLASLGLIPTSGQELAVRLWGFAYIGISFVIAVGIDKLFTSDANNRSNLLDKSTKLLPFFAIFLIIIGGVSIGNKPIHRVPDLLSPKLSSGSGSLTTDVFYAAEWSESNLGRYNKIAANRAVSNVFEGHGIQNVERWNAWQVFYPQTMDRNVTLYLGGFGINYLVVDLRDTYSLSEFGTYFSDLELKSPYSIYGYGYTRPLPRENIEKFDSSSILYKIYDNGNIRTYSVNKIEL